MNKSFFAEIVLICIAIVLFASILVFNAFSDGNTDSIEITQNTTTENTVTSISQNIDNEDVSITKININTATINELKELAGIGDVIAQRIIDYRLVTKFKSIEDIKNVNGIGEKVFEKIRNNIEV